MTPEDIQMEEWKEIRESIRYFGTKRFTQLTVFIATTGFLCNAYLNQPSWSWIFQSGGLAIAILFLLMERSSVQYWTKFAERAVIIEAALKPLELMTKFRPKEGRFLGATFATYATYGLAVAFWLTTLFVQSVSPVTANPSTPAPVPTTVTTTPTPTTSAPVGPPPATPKP